LIQPLGRRRALLLIVLVCGVLLAAWPVPATVVIDRPAGDATLLRTVALWTLLNVVLGAVMIWQRPGQLYPWLMFSTGLMMVRLETGALSAGTDSLYFPAVTVPAVLAQLFPSGRPIAGRWGWLTYLSPVSLFAAVFTSRWLGDSSPAMAVLGALWVVGLVATFPVVALRFHRSSGVERAQMKWFLFAVVAALLLWLASIALVATYPSGGTWGSAVALSLPAVGIGVALLRFRLYDIDRVISRTTAYVLVTWLVGATYLVLTLAAAAALRPSLHKVQTVVDRRFNRTRYDGEATVIAFARGLNRHVDVGAIEADLIATVNGSLRPRLLSLWLRGGS
jgi:hypothetical protein